MRPSFFTRLYRVTSFSHRLAILALLTLLVCTALLYLPGLSGDFLFDDFNEIVGNPAIRIEQLSWPALVEAWNAFPFVLFGRPLPMLSLAIDHSIWGLNPFGFKLTNLLIHLLNTAALWLLATRILQLVPNADKMRWPFATSLLLAAVWAIHPLQVSTVLYAVQRMEMMAATFTILGLWCFLEGRLRLMTGRPGALLPLTGALACALLALLCKETGLLLPAYAFILDFALLRFGTATPAAAKRLKSVWAILGAGALATFLLYFWPQYTDEFAYLSREFGWHDRLLSQLRILPMYLGQVLWPDPQHYLFYYDSLTPSRSLVSPPSTIWGGALLLSLLVTALFWRRRFPLFTLGILWFFVSHALTSNIVALELAFEHRNYLALFGVALAVTDLLRPLIERLSTGFKGASAAALLVFLAGMTLITTATWGNPLELALAFQKRNPGSERAHYDMGIVYRQMSDGNPDSPFVSMAEAAFKKAAAVPNSSPLPEHALIVMQAFKDGSAEEKWWERLVEKVETGPAGPMQIRAVRTLLQIHRQSHALDPERLMDAGIALLNKPGINPSINLEFALLAIEDLDDESLGMALLNAGAARAGNPEWANQVRSYLSESGHPDFARRWWNERN